MPTTQPKDSVEEKIRLPYMPLYVADLLASPKVQVMTTEQFGAYMLILATCWHSGECRVRADDQSLGQVTRLGAARWKKIKGPLMDCLTVEAGYATNEKLQTVWSEAIEAHKKNRDRAAKAARGRWGSNASSNAPSIPPSNAKESCLSNAILKPKEQNPPSEDINPQPPFDPPGLLDPLSDRAFDESPNRLRDEADFLGSDHGATGGWNHLEAAAGKGYRALPSGLSQAFWQIRGDPELWDLCQQAMAKMRTGLQNGAKIGLETFLKEQTIRDIVGGKHDFTPGKPRQRAGVGLNAVAASSKPEGRGSEAPIGGPPVDL